MIFLQCLCETCIVQELCSVLPAFYASISQHLFESTAQAARRASAEAQAMQADPDHSVHMWIRVVQIAQTVFTPFQQNGHRMRIKKGVG